MMSTHTLYSTFSAGRSTVFWNTSPCLSNLTDLAQLSKVPVTYTSPA